MNLLQNMPTTVYETQSFDLSNLPEGLYLVQVQAGDLSQTSKLMMAR
jgi:hypothetical protein